MEFEGGMEYGHTDDIGYGVVGRKIVETLPILGGYVVETVYFPSCGRRVVLCPFDVVRVHARGCRWWWK
jgi:hypothetical protein